MFRSLLIHSLRKDAPQIAVLYFDLRLDAANPAKGVHARLRQRGYRAADQIISPYPLGACVTAGFEASQLNLKGSVIV